MLDLPRISKEDRLMRATTGLNGKAFDSLLPRFEQAYQEHLLEQNVERKREPKGGRKATLRTQAEKLFYIFGSPRYVRIEEKVFCRILNVTPELPEL
jgi:hypothetical protein